MRKALYIIGCLGLLVLSSCQDVVDVELDNSDSRLVVDALIRVDESQEFVPVEIKVTRTNGFFDEILPVSDIDIIYIYYGVEDEYGEIINGGYSNLAEVDPGTGIYIPDPTFTSDQRIRTNQVGPETTFWLFIEYEDRIYASKTNYAPSVPIESLTQGPGDLFDNETEVVISYTDIPDMDNFYVFDFDFANYLASEDTFYQGQSFSFSYFYDDQLETGQQVQVSILGADLRFYNYINLILQQTQNNQGFFETPVATIRGNIFDVTGIDNLNNFDNVEQPDNFPLGYFSFSQVFTDSLTVE